MQPEEFRLDHSAFFRFKQVAGRYLMTNDTGQFAFVQADDFEKYVTGKLAAEAPVYRELEQKGFTRNGHSIEMARRLRSKSLFLGLGPVLHILIPTLRCNQQCVYCHASAARQNDPAVDMAPDTARKIVDTIFQAPSRSLTIEFQGGEPLLNWDVVRLVTEYAREKEKESDKRVNLLLVSNLLALDETKLEFLIERGVGLCTSLDGHAALHNRNRGGHAVVRRNIESAVKAYREKLPHRLPSAIVTVTRHSLPHAREIVDEYVSLGFEGIFVRPLNPVGYARDVADRIDYSPDEYLEFYKQLLDYVLAINAKDKRHLFEQTAVIFLLKILTEIDPNFMDIRSPCGAGIGQIAYNYNGDAYTCDEARMVGATGDFIFRMGNVHNRSYRALLDTDVVKTLCAASCLEGLPTCADCAYKPYCGVCPVLNYVETGDIFLKSLQNRKCRLNMGILDLLFERLQNPESRRIFESWIG